MTPLWLIATCSILLMAHAADGKKDKHKSKHKSYHPVVAADVSAYAGKYVGIDSLYSVEVSVGTAAELMVEVHEGATTARLTDVRCSSAHLSGTFPAVDGVSKPFDATFVERDLNGDRVFGLLIESVLRISDDVVLDRIFCARR
jgi:hypothetical protein